MNKTKLLLATFLAVLALAIGSSILVKASDISIEWDLNEGTLEITTVKTGILEAVDCLSVSTDGDSSSGWQLVSANPNEDDWHVAGFSIERFVSIDDGGEVETWTLRDNNYPAWGGKTLYFAGLETDDSGTLYQDFSTTYFRGDMETGIVVDCSYLIEAGEFSNDTYGEFFFLIGGNGTGNAVLGLDLTDFSETGCTPGRRLMTGSFYFAGSEDDPSAGFMASGESLLDIEGFIDVDNILTTFDVDVAGGDLGPIGGEGDEVEIYGHVEAK